MARGDTKDGQLQRDQVHKGAYAKCTFNAHAIKRKLKRDRRAKTISPGAPVFFSAILEYLCAEMLELSGAKAVQAMKGNSKGPRINQRAIYLAVQEDPELRELLDNAVIHEGGVVPNIHDELKNKALKKKSQSQKTKKSQAAE